MARARNIKPAFFDNDELAENDPLGRLLFIGLWTLADYQGNLEWRSKRIQKQILAYDKCDINKLAINLDKSGFIRFYSDGDNLFINILNFTKHQNPHKNERDKGSEIPSYSDDGRQLVDLKGLTINRDLSGLKPEDSDSNRADSLLLIPDSPILNPDTSDKDSLSGKPDVISVIEHLNSVTGSKYKPTTKSHSENISARLKDYSVDELKQVISFKFKEWGNDDRMAGYLRPSTLFSAGKFDGYLLAAKAAPIQKSSLHDLSGIKYESGDL